MTHRTIRIALAAAAFLAPVSGAMADRLPNETEKAAITAALAERGFTSWKDIEFDDGRWEVDDARGADGVKHDIHLDQNFKITSVKPDR
ncbi:PepSY domain-containing protein [Terrihabitans sp. B22-R8]|uniref:PepSY domain-containing protein n=1 Tax=Terrihabitans sp. B22-R8 TaxID=3425128 RepID=UPI00403C5C3C